MPFEPPARIEPLTPAQRWFNRFCPSVRLRRDPLSDWRVEGRYAPVSIANWKLTPMMRRALLARRAAQPLAFADDQRLTIVIPFRDREAHLRELLPPLTAVLSRQQVRFRILVVEQLPEGLFNRGKLLNIGMQHAKDVSDYYCLHDVDAVPVLANYACPSQPLRLVSTIVHAPADRPAHAMVQSSPAAIGRAASHDAPRVDPSNRHAHVVASAARADYYFSGAISIRKEQAYAANGYSNEYWGWGKEDDDFFFRLLLAGYLCYYDTQGVFHDLPNPAHQQVERNSRTTPPHVGRNRRRRSLLVRGLIDPRAEGLSSLRYELLEHHDRGDHERILVRW